MALKSMTGFARADAVVDAVTFQVEARCVNGRSSDIKLRLPSGLERLDKPIRTAFQAVIRRGNAQVSVTQQREVQRRPALNHETLEALRAALRAQAAKWDDDPPKLADLITLPGVVEMIDPSASPLEEDAQERSDAGLVACAARCAAALDTARQQEGQALEAVLLDLIVAIEQETEALAANEDASAPAFFERLREQVAKLTAAQTQFDPQRLHQEVALLASKADIEEELARLRAHCAAARTLLEDADPVGRRLDFLAQEFNREANTICSKAGSIAVTQHGLALKALIDQMKEQVQNVE